MNPPLQSKQNNTERSFKVHMTQKFIAGNDGELSFFICDLRSPKNGFHCMVSLCAGATVVPLKFFFLHNCNKF